MPAGIRSIEDREKGTLLHIKTQYRVRIFDWSTGREGEIELSESEKETLEALLAEKSGQKDKILVYARVRVREAETQILPAGFGRAAPADALGCSLTNTTDPPRRFHVRCPTSAAGFFLQIKFLLWTSGPGKKLWEMEGGAMRRSWRLRGPRWVPDVFAGSVPKLL